MIHLQLYVFDSYEKEVLVDFYIDILHIQGYYDDPDDETVINLLSYGKLYTVKRKHSLMNQLKYNEN